MRGYGRTHLVTVLGMALLMTLVSSSLQFGLGAIDMPTLSDNSNDVLKITIQNGLPTSVTFDQSEGSVDITSVAASFSTDVSQNSTMTIELSGTPLVDEYHAYWLWFSGSASMANNDTHYLGILIFVTITGMSSDTVTTGAEMTLFHGLYSFQDPNAVYPQYLGGLTKLVSYGVSGSSLTVSFNISTLTDNQQFLELWSTVTRINATSDNPFQTQHAISTGFMAYAYKSNVANQPYFVTGSGTYWWDFAPDEESSNVIPFISETASLTNIESSESSEATTSPENSTLVGIPTPGFTVMEITVVGVAMVILGVATRIISPRRKEKKY